MYKRILMAYDGTELGQKVLLECQDLMQWTGAALTLVAVMPHYTDFISAESGFYDPTSAEREKELHKRSMEQGLQALESGLKKLGAAGFKATGEVLVGETIDQICKQADKIEADLIIVGHKHLDGWAARWWRGSSTSSLVEHARCSVLVVVT